MKKNNTRFLLAVVGVLLAVLSWRLIYVANNEETEAIKIENEEVLQPQIDRLEELDANKQQYIDDTIAMEDECAGIIERFPADVLTEDQIMYYNNLELAVPNEAAIPTISMSEPTELPYSGTTTVEEFELQDDGIQMFDQPTAVSFTTTYNGLKNTFHYIYSVPGRKAIKSISLSAAADGYLSASMNMDFYYLTGTPLLYDPEPIPAVPLGKDNVFGTLDGNDEAAEEAEVEAEAEE